MDKIKLRDKDNDDDAFVIFSLIFVEWNFCYVIFFINYLRAVEVSIGYV